MWVNLMLSEIQSFYGFLKDGEVMLEPQESPVCQIKDRNLQVSLMTSCVWFGSCPNQEGGDAELMHVLTV